MVTYSIIKLSQLEGAHRLDSEYYQPEYFIDFSKGSWVPIGETLDICQYGLSLAMNDDKKGYPMFKMDDIHDGFLFDDEVRYADISHGLFEQFKIEKDDIFFNRVNSEEFVGRTGIFKLAMDAVFASYLIRVRPKADSGILPDYLNVFLNSSYGQKQIHKYARRAVNQANVNAEELRQFKIFLMPLEEQEKISALSNESWEHYVQAKFLYSRAENLLSEELGLKDFKVEEDLSYIVNLSEVKSSHRADAEYFQPKYEKLVEKIKKYGTAPLLDLVQNIAARFNPKSQPTKLFQYVELSNITSTVGTIDGFSEVLGDEAPSRAKRVLKSGDVILSSVEGSLEKVALVDKEQEGYLASNGFFQFRSKDILPEALLVLAKSFVLQMQFKKQTAGTILTAVPKEAVENIAVPKINKPTQQKIVSLVQQSHEARKKAKELLEEAKQKVENFIEANK